MLTALEWANTPSFPDKTKTDPNILEPGFDPIIGAALSNLPEPSREMIGFDENNQTKSLTLTDDWVIAKGGEYFFSPSISALQETFAQAA